MAATRGLSISCSRVDYRYPGSRLPALSGVGFEIPAGARVGLLGPNGAGKSTLMRLLCGYLPLRQAGASARLQVGRWDLRRAGAKLRAQIGYLPEQVPLYQELRVREHLEFRAAIKRVPRRLRSGEIGRVSELTGLRDMLEVPIHKLSRGYRQRTGLAEALLGSPPLVVLDEPTVGLDPNQVRAIRGMLRELGGRQTLLFSSHVLGEVEALCDRVLILSRGELVVDESVGEATRADRIRVWWRGEPGPGRAALERAWARVGAKLPMEASLDYEDGVSKARVEAGELNSSDLCEAVGASFAETELALVRLEPGRGRLEARFAAATGFEEDGQL